MSLIKVTEALIAERGFNDELLANLTAAIDNDIVQLQLTIEDLAKRKEELATEFATRRASLSALIGEEGASNG